MVHAAFKIAIAHGSCPQFYIGSVIPKKFIANNPSTPFYLSGTILIIVGLITIWVHRMKKEDVRRSFSESVKMAMGAGFVLIFTVPMVRIYINSGINPSNLPGMPIVMAEWVAVNVGNIYPLFAPSIGALGAFIAGSNTVSNLMFSFFNNNVIGYPAIPHTADAVLIFFVK